MDTNNVRRQLIDELTKLLVPERLAAMQRVLANRTRYITVAVENVFQSQNASAILRTCDCLGIQNINIIERYNTYRVNPEIAMGSDQWLTVNKYPNSSDVCQRAIADLRSSGYRIVATTPHQGDISLPDFDLTKGSVAIFLGTELQGLTNDVLDNADEFLRIPMYGFTESFNVSVSAAIVLYNLVERLHLSDIEWQLSPADYDEVLLSWLLRTIKRSEQVVKRICCSMGICADPFILPPTDVVFDHRY